ncbi:2-hydroxychromene-2-carboxylate isomerase [Marinivivus vitaminiproducens]|uniref:2-hydroxychromene-2-carboxylate isomerase n=1 Tax=Marinivivus vitaminiproducens TaxID=3035935 RepID=UPI0027A2186A|nr:2-hydroxychromene-2-carboxylate isomerase [Geminicoccaceae bacterium SCSIO 64248]
MSRPRIDYFFTLVSPWCYLGNRVFAEMARRHEAEIVYKPFDAGAVFKVSGGLPLARRAPQRQAYRLIELQRWRDIRGLKLALHPKHFPADPSLSHRMLLAALREGADVGPFVQAVLQAVWVEEEDIGDPGTLVRLADGSELDGARLLELSSEPAIRAAETASTEEAVARDVFGAPFYVLNGEPFWGQDRLEMLDRALASGRAPFRAGDPR